MNTNVIPAVYHQSDAIEPSSCRLIKGIPSSQIVTASGHNKDYELEFINANNNNDVYTLTVFLRKDGFNHKYKIRAQIESNILAYPALDMVWSFGDDEHHLASRVYHRICDEVDEIKDNYDNSMAPITIVANKTREYLKPISARHREITHILPIDEAEKLAGEPDARMSIYHGHYPNMSDEEKHEHRKFFGNDAEKKLERKSYSTREKY